MQFEAILSDLNFKSEQNNMTNDYKQVLLKLKNCELPFFAFIKAKI